MDARYQLVRRILGFCSICLSLAACEDNTTIDPVTGTRAVEPRIVGRVAVTRDVVTIEEGQSTRIRAGDGSAASRDVTWSSDDEEIAVVDARGNIRGIAVGTTTLTVVSRNESSDVVVTVLPATSEGVRNVKPLR